LNLSLDACGANILDLNDYDVEDAALQVACSSTVVVNVAGSLDLDAAQNAQVYIVGNPAISDFNLHQNASVQPK
jgi:hypothetical protein